MASKVNIASVIKRKNKLLQEQFAQELARNAFEEWSGMVDEINPRFQEPYRKAMSMYRAGNDIIIELDYSKAGSEVNFVRAIEYGYGAGGIGSSGSYDMRNTLLKSPKAKTSPKTGHKYLDVPFKMNAGTVQKFGGADAVSAARKLAYYREAADRKASLRRYQLGDPSGFAEKIQPNAREVKLGGITTAIPAHATDPLANLYRFQKPGGAAEFGTFRRISNSPNGKPWVGAPIKQHRLMRRLKKRMPGLIQRTKGKVL